MGPVLILTFSSLFPTSPAEATDFVQITNQQVVFTPVGSTVMDVTVTCQQDTAVEGPETFLLQVASITGPAGGVGSTCTVTCTDDDSTFSNYGCISNLLLQHVDSGTQHVHVHDYSIFIH